MLRVERATEKCFLLLDFVRPLPLRLPPVFTPSLAHDRPINLRYSSRCLSLYIPTVPSHTEIPNNLNFFPSPSTFGGFGGTYLG